MKSYRVKQSDVARMLELSRNCVSHKIRGKVDFTASEMYAIRDKYFPDKTIDWLFQKMEV